MCTSLENCKCASVDDFCTYHDVWLRKKDGDDRAVTYLDMSGKKGGQLCIEEGLMEQRFVEAYSKSMLHGQSHFICEKKTEFFNMFYDIDEKNFSVKSERRNRNKYAQVLQEDIKRFYPSIEPDDPFFDCFVSTPTSIDGNDFECYREVCNSTGNSYLKCGMHVHFPNIVVDRHQALLIRESGLSILERRIPFEKDSNIAGWEEVIDSCVYDANGLRMLGSCKCAICSVCKRNPKKRPNCKKCNGVGKEYIQRRYMIHLVLLADGTIDEEMRDRLYTDWETAIDMVTIRSCERAPDSRFVRYSGCPSYKSELNSVLGRKKVRRFKVDEASSKDLGITTKSRSLDITESRNQVLKSVIKKLGGDMDAYANIEIKDAVFWGDDNRQLCVRVTGEGSNWCPNVKRDHSSNTVYFVVTPEYAKVKCWSKKKCSHYQSSVVTLSQYEALMLFPSETGSSDRGKDKKRKKIVMGGDSSFSSNIAELAFLENKKIKTK